MTHTDNAVAYYNHLIEQDVPAEQAMAHTAVRFGILPDVLRERLRGGVAYHDATMEALAEARAILMAEDEVPGYEVEDALRALYNAVTGESL